MSQHNQDRWSRATTGFGILKADCHNCGTQFPRIKTNWSFSRTNDQGWCRILDCEEEVLTVNAIPGSVLFWRNIDEDGMPEGRTLHAGLELANGSKAGVNIWTRLSPSETIMRSESSGDMQ
jgi:prolyl 4-hydroxylase